MRINIKNCNNIDEGTFDIIENRLNIKYAINGTGKSTISKAIDAFVNDDVDKKNSLLPFKYYGKDNEGIPELIGYDSIKKLQYIMKKIYKTMCFSKQNCSKIVLKYL